MESEGSRRQSSEPTNRNRIQGGAERTRLLNKSKSNTTQDSVSVNAAAAWNEGCWTLSGEIWVERSDRSKAHRKVRLNIQKSAQTIVLEKLVKARGGKGLAVEDKRKVKRALQ